MSSAQRTAPRSTKPLTATPWGTKDFYVEDPDGYIVCFGGRPAADAAPPSAPHNTDAA